MIDRNEAVATATRLLIFAVGVGLFILLLVTLGAWLDDPTEAAHTAHIAK
jgi:hypothetical protein